MIVMPIDPNVNLYLNPPFFSGGLVARPKNILGSREQIHFIFGIAQILMCGYLHKMIDTSIIIW